MSGFLLDTVTVSELRKAEKADPKVVAWQKSVSGLSVWLSVITLVEIRVGIGLVRPRAPDFAARLEAWYRQKLLSSFEGRLLSVDQAVGEMAGELRVSAGLTPYDALIGATAQVHGLTLVTRNVGDFKDVGIAIIDPWQGGSE